MPVTPERTLGEKLALSVPTAIPFEEQVVDHEPGVQQIWANIYTLFRNYHGAFEDPLAVDRTALITGFAEELHTLQGLMEGVVELRYYRTNVKALSERFPLAKVKTPKTQRQLTYANLERLALSNAMRDNGLQILECQQLLPTQPTNGWVLTHHALDLMSRYQFNDLKLLESHTGVIKPPREWITKLTTNPAQQHLPFNLLTMQVFGDRGHLFYSHGAKYKKALLEVAQKGRWTPATTRDKVKMDIKQYLTAEIRDTFSDMLMTTLR